MSEKPTLQEEYYALTALVLRMGAWLTGPKAGTLPRAEWEEQYARYGEQLQRLCDLGDELRPVSTRYTPPTEDALTQEVMELFADPFADPLPAVAPHVPEAYGESDPER